MIVSSPFYPQNKSIALLFILLFKVLIINELRVVLITAEYESEKNKYLKKSE